MKVKLSDAQLADMDAFLAAQVDRIPTGIPDIKISEFSERRVMPPGSPREGRWENRFNPPLIEPMDSMSPQSPIQREIILKAAQVGATALEENLICYYMSVVPSDILFISADEGVLERWATRRLEPAIDSFGIRGEIRSQINDTKSRRVGDKVFSKEYSGCRLDMASARSAGKLRATDKRILVRDEIDGAPSHLTTGEGYWMDVSWARTNSWRERRKVIDSSTATTYEDSEIWKAYQESDQRLFMIPCPRCGVYQPLEFGTEGSVHGLKGETKAGELAHVFCICSHCHDAFFDHDKPDMLAAGYWEPTSVSSNPYWRSRHISSLYSPFMPFYELWDHWEKAKKDPDGMRSFTNLYMGMPYRETGRRPKANKLLEQHGNYKSGEISSDNILFLTAGVDVQRGSKKEQDIEPSVLSLNEYDRKLIEDEFKAPPRLEMEICAHGAGYKTWSIAYLVVVGSTKEAYSGAWEALNEFALEGGLVFKRGDDREFSPMLILIDSGDGPNISPVYQFADGWVNTFASKGFRALSKRKKEEGDAVDRSNFKRYRMARMSEGITLAEISTNYYKTLIYRNLQIPRRSDNPQRSGFCEFPSDYTESYFKQLTAEERYADGSFHAHGRRNEALDVRVLNCAAMDVYTDMLLTDMRSVAKEAGWTAAQCQAITKRDVLREIAKEIDPR